MHPELLKLPFTTLTVKSYGLMMVIGFLAAVWVIRRLSRDITPDPQMITNCSLYALIAGVVGARIFFVIHYYERFRGDLLSVFALWEGGLELLGGVLAAIAVIVFYLRRHKLPTRQYLDILAIGLMLALVFGRIGCFLNGCCFGKPTDAPWAVRFPYGSFAYRSQIYPNLKRNRPQPQLQLPQDFFGYLDEKNNFDADLKPFGRLSPEQKQMATKGPYRCLPVHPTQLYSSAKAAVLCLVLYLFWRRAKKAQEEKKDKPFTKPGSTFALMFIVYGIARFFMEFLRDDNPFEAGWWTIYKGTISQNISIYFVILGVILMMVFARLNPQTPSRRS
jgi:phosphatidylglycerol:prolipoprotein diacylglycerol transferase